MGAIPEVAVDLTALSAVGGPAAYWGSAEALFAASGTEEAAVGIPGDWLGMLDRRLLPLLTSCTYTLVFSSNPQTHSGSLVLATHTYVAWNVHVHP